MLRRCSHQPHHDGFVLPIRYLCPRVSKSRRKRGGIKLGFTLCSETCDLSRKLLNTSAQCPPMYYSLLAEYALF